MQEELGHEDEREIEEGAKGKELAKHRTSRKVRSFLPLLASQRMVVLSELVLASSAPFGCQRTQVMGAVCWFVSIRRSSCVIRH